MFRTLVIILLLFVAGCAVDRKDLSQNQKDVLLWMLDNPEERKTSEELGLTSTEHTQLRQSGWIVSHATWGGQKYSLSVTGIKLAESLKQEEEKLEILRTKYMKD